MKNKKKFKKLSFAHTFEMDSTCQFSILNEEVKTTPVKHWSGFLLNCLELPELLSPESGENY